MALFQLIAHHQLVIMIFFLFTQKYISSQNQFGKVFMILFSFHSHFYRYLDILSHTYQRRDQLKTLLIRAFGSLYSTSSKLHKKLNNRIAIM